MFTPTPREQFDRLQLAALAGLMCLGAAFVFSATMANEYSATLPWYSQSWVRQIVWYAIGIGAAAAVCVLDYNTLARWSFVAYWAAIFSLVAALADSDAGLSAQPAARLFWPGLHTLCFADSHAGGVATPAPTTVGRRI